MAMAPKRRTLPPGVLGEGGFAEVLVVEHPRRIARKLFKEGQEAAAKREFEFNRDNAPNGCFFILMLSTFLGNDGTNERRFFDMEIEAGNDLETVIDNQIPFNADLICGDLILAFLELARYKVVHWDIKAANCIVSLCGHIKICDFGLSCVVGSLTSKLGTIGYAPPEVLNNFSRHTEMIADRSADQFQLGLLFLHIFSGHSNYYHSEQYGAAHNIKRYTDGDHPAEILYYRKLFNSPEYLEHLMSTFTTPDPNLYRRHQEATAALNLPTVRTSTISGTFTILTTASPNPSNSCVRRYMTASHRSRSGSRGKEPGAQQGLLFRSPIGGVQS